MDEIKPNEGQTPVQAPSSLRYEGQAIEKPTSVTVFGILNIIFGGLGLLCTPIVTALELGSTYTEMETTTTYTAWNLAGSCIGFGFSIWLLALGIGLLMMKSWARRGSIIYSIAFIIWIFLGVGIEVAALSLDWIIIPESQIPLFIGWMCCGFCGGLIYPILLLIFMLTPKVKAAFEALQGQDAASFLRPGSV
jgi:hypothetical protein